MQFTGERVIPGATPQPSVLMRDHVLRYAWALEYVAGLHTVDLGCGTGYGTEMLSWTAKSVIGVDVDPDALTFARERFPGQSFLWEDLDNCSTLPPADVYVCFETLEHLERPDVVIELTAGKRFLWSVPVESPSRYHKQVYTLEQAGQLVPDSHIWHQYSVGTILPHYAKLLNDNYIKYVLGMRG